MRSSIFSDVFRKVVFLLSLVLWGYASALCADSPDIEKLRLSGDQAYDKNEFDKAKAVYLQILALSPKDFKAASNVGLICRRAKDYACAAKYYQLAYEIDPKSVESAVSAAISIVRIHGDANVAIKLIRESIQKGRTEVEIYDFLISCYAELRSVEKGRKALSEALTAYPNHPVLLHHGLTFELLFENYAEALVYAEKFLATGKATASDEVNIGNVYVLSKQCDKGLPLLQHALKSQETLTEEERAVILYDTKLCESHEAK